ncbi:MAG: PhoH family protein [Lachnospiraceae bacterium]|nr:PhoH family protein [Lachnospiraceae bacterium]
MAYTEKEITLPAGSMQTVFGQFDRNVRKLERALGISYVVREDRLLISGEEYRVEQASRVLQDLAGMAESKSDITEQSVDYAISLVMEERSERVSDLDREVICHSITGRPVKPKTYGQRKYVEAIDKNMIVFGTGPAGTGKTYLAMAMAITAFKQEEVGRIILTRPAIEAGEKLGFLPGDLQSKVDPYLRPLYDALYQIMGGEAFQKNMEKGLIEVAPLAYMRGRTLDNSFIILDEAQNTTPAQMKMFLTRIGFGYKVVITGDLTQKDLSAGTKSGLEEALRVLKKMEGISFCTLTSKDVVRHPLVMRIVQAYDNYENANRKKERQNRV